MKPEIGSEGALNECSRHLNCSSVVPGGLEAQGLEKGTSGILMCVAAEKGVFGGFDLLLAPWAGGYCQFGWPRRQKRRRRGRARCLIA